MKAREPLTTALRALAAGAVGNHRTVLLTYPGLRLGNVLYFALHAHLRTADGAPYRVVDPDPEAGWDVLLPGLAPLLEHPDAVRRTDRREHIPATFLQAFGVDFTAAQLADFIRERVLDAVLAAGTPAPRDAEPPDVVVNVRRGDYYSVPAFRRIYGFDVPAFVRSAVLELEQRSGPAAQVSVVSDDPGWCREHLSFLETRGRVVTWSAPGAGALSNLADIARGRRLVLANSTFSYWGAYLSNVLHGDNHGSVHAPDLHSRGTNDGRPWQHDPRWRVVPVAAPRQQG